MHVTNHAAPFVNWRNERLHEVFVTSPSRDRVIISHEVVAGPESERNRFSLFVEQHVRLLASDMDMVVLTC
jgi:hypothetical protein